MKLKLVLFDLDGTLLDTAPDFIVCVNQLRQRHGHEPMSASTIRAEVSNGARALTKLALGLPDDSEHLEPARQELLALYADCLGSQTIPFPGIPESLDWIRDHDLGWGIVTNKPSLYTLPLLARVKLPGQPAAVICPDHVTHTKPHPEPILMACQQHGCLPGEAIYLGDHIRDIEAGKAAGAHTASCGWGYLHQDDDWKQWQADHHLQRPDQLPALLAHLY